MGLGTYYEPLLALSLSHTAVMVATRVYGVHISATAALLAPSAQILHLFRFLLGPDLHIHKSLM